MFWWAKKKRLTNAGYEILSPNGRNQVKFLLENGKMFYEVWRDGNAIIRKSELGIQLAGEELLGENLSVVRERRQKHAEAIELPWGEDHFIPNNYNEATFYLEETTKPARILTIKFRVFDDAAAFFYEIPAQPKFQQVTIMEEKTEFALDPNAKVWKIPAYQPDRYEYNYEETRAFEIVGSVHTPMTFNTPNGYYGSIHEAALYDYGSMTLKLDARGAVAADITPLSDGSKAHVELPFRTPWRLIMLADSAIMLTKNRVMLALNDPPKKEIDFSWVKPLKFLGIWWAMFVGEWTWAPGERHGATTEHAKEYIDACERLKIPGLLIEGWNEGWEGDWLLEGEHNSFLKDSENFDLPAVSRYARTHNVELVGHHETVGFVDNYENQIEAAYRLYAENGVHYVKTGYAGRMMVINGRREFHHSQVGVRHYQRTVELAAKYRICLDIHEPIKSTGIERTWPNLLSREGARGQEYEGGALLPSHACFLPYTRLLAGGMDYTPGIFDLGNNVRRIYTTLAKQLAYYVTIYSAMTMAADRPRFYEEKFPEMFKFIQEVPNNFEETRPLMGEIGKYYVVARRGRDSLNWFVGGVTNEESRTVRILLDFLDEGAYEATIYRDKDDAHYKDNPFAYQIDEIEVTKNSEIQVFMAPGGGFAIEVKKK